MRLIWTRPEAVSLRLNCSSSSLRGPVASELAVVTADWILLVAPVKCVAVCDVSEANRMMVWPLGMMARGLWPCYLLALTLYEECVSIPAEKRHLVSAHGALPCGGLGNGPITFSSVWFPTMDSLSHALLSPGSLLNKLASGIALFILPGFRLFAVDFFFPHVHRCLHCRQEPSLACTGK